MISKNVFSQDDCSSSRTICFSFLLLKYHTIENKHSYSPSSSSFYGMQSRSTKIWNIYVNHLEEKVDRTKNMLQNMILYLAKEGHLWCLSPSLGLIMVVVNYGLRWVKVKRENECIHDNMIHSEI